MITPAILLVDDRPENLLALEAVLEPLGLDLVRADSGTAALHQVLERDFAAILLDVQMPGMDGFEVAQHLRSTERSRHIPILFLTAIDATPDRVMQGYTLGAVDFLQKPLHPGVLRSKVAVFAELDRRARLLREAEQRQTALRHEVEIREAESRAVAELLAQLQEQATELEQQYEEAQTLTEELEETNEALRAVQAERERLHRRVEAERTELLQIFESAPAVMAIYSGPDHIVTRVNPTWERTVGKPGAVGRPFQDVFPEFRDTGLFELLDRVYETGEPFSNPEVNVPLERFGSGVLEDTYWNLVWLPLTTPEGRDILVHAVEMTEQVRMRQEVERYLATLEAKNEEAMRLREEAENASRAKSEFLANMSHELRTPLNAILGYAELLDLGIAGPITEGQRAQIGRMQASSRHLLGLINEILDLAKIEAGRMDVAHEPGWVSEGVAATLVLIHPQAAERGITIENQCRPDEETPYIGDDGRVRQILLNLLSNAVKFTDAGGRVVVRCRLAIDPLPGAHLGKPGPWICIEIEDTGVGIAPELLGSIFNPFVQAETGRTRIHSGTGLGLTISREFARLMGGDLTLQSTLGKGSCFTLWLPTTAPAGLASPDTALPGRRRRVPKAPALVDAGKAMKEELEVIIAAFVNRQRVESLLPMAGQLSDSDLEDHVASFLADIAQALVILGETGGEPELMRDGSDLQRLISERHGAQRAGLGWSEEALRQEFRILQEEIETALRRKKVPRLESAVDVLRGFIDRASEIGVRGLRLARLSHQEL